MASSKKATKKAKAKAPAPPARQPGSDDGLDFIPRADLIPWPGLNSRQRFDESALEELRATIEQDGILQPLGVRYNDEPPHWIYAGERRWRASEGILDELPCITRQISDAAAHRLVLTENLQRSDLTAVEEAWGIERYMAAVAAEGIGGLTQTVVADQLGRSQAWVANRLRLLKLPEAVLELIQGELLTPTQARDLILPFAALPAEAWERLSNAVATALAKAAKKRDEPFGDEDLRRQVSDVACAMSSWLDHPIYLPQPEDTHHQLMIRIPEQRWKTAPAGTVIQYVYGHYGNKSSRAFDPDWWSEEMRAEEARLMAEHKAVAEGEPGRGPEPADLDWSPDLGVIGVDVDVPYHQRHVVSEGSHGQSWERDGLGRLGDEGGPALIYADPTLIPEECLVIQEGAPGVGKYDRDRTLAVLCTRFDVFAAAERGLEEKHVELVRRRKAQRVKEELRAAADVKLGSAASLLGVYMIGLLDDGLDICEGLAEVAGVALPEVSDDDLWRRDGLEIRREQLGQLSPNDLDRLFRFGVARFERGGVDAFSAAGQEQAVGRELRNQLCLELRAKLEPLILTEQVARLLGGGPAPVVPPGPAAATAAEASS